jgi:hypothetical protein
MSAIANNARPVFRLVAITGATTDNLRRTVALRS